MAETRQPSGIITLNDLPYLLGMADGKRPLWRPMQFRTQEGDPTLPGRWRWKDWSKGLGDSRGAMPGAVHYAENAYLGATGRILPGPKITTIETNLDGDPKDIEEVTVPASRVLVGGGTKVAEVNPSTHAVATTATLTGDVLSMQLFDEQVAIAVGDAVDYYVRSSAGAYAQNSISKKARCFGLLTNGDLLRGTANKRSLNSAANITSVDNWSVELAIGDPTGNVNQIFGHHGWEYLLKDEGLYTFDEENSDEVSVLSDLEDWKSAENRWFYKWGDHVFVCTLGGQYRYVQQGFARTVGIEELPFNESEISNVYPTAGVAFGRHKYDAWYDGTTTWITVGRRALEGDAAGTSPFTHLSVIDKFTGVCRTMKVVVGDDGPEVWYGYTNGDVRYFKASRDGLPVEYRDSGTMKVEFSPTDMGAPATIKQARAIETVARDLSAARNIQWAMAADGGSYNNAGSPLTSLDNGLATAYFTRNTNDAGREIQLRATLGLDSSSTPPSIRDVILDYEWRPEMVPGAVVGLRLRDEWEHEGVVERRTALEQREALEALLDGPIQQVKDPWGDTYAVRVSNYEGDTTWAFSGAEMQMDIAIALRKLDYS